MKLIDYVFTPPIVGTFIIILGFYLSVQYYYEFDLHFAKAQSSDLVSNKSIADTVNSSIHDFNDVNITMFRGACFGACPIYYIEINGDGKVTYGGFEYVNVTGERTSSIPVDSVRQLVQKIISSGYYNLSDKYDQVDRTDQATVVTTVNIDGKSKSVYDYLGTHLLPAMLPLRELENMIDNVTNSSQWVGPGIVDQALNSNTTSHSPTS
ncbi:MAG TPA: DUF6438 domain-containing protein [Nitrososphaeraceae archaeon]|jgi:hypothetical protein